MGFDCLRNFHLAAMLVEKDHEEGLEIRSLLAL
jgi:hypothetical protein